MAQAILLADVDTLGERGDVVDVSPGYLRNFLVPRKLAQPATAGSIAEATRRKDAAERAVREAAEKAQENAALLSKTVLTITHPAGDDGKLFGSVTARKSSTRSARREASGWTSGRSTWTSRSAIRDRTWSRSRCTRVSPRRSRPSSPPASPASSPTWQS
jgi:large subunit ribosomal protein L9